MRKNRSGSLPQEKFPEGTTANVKSVVTYPADLFDTVKWHDGSPISVGDFVMTMIQSFDPAKTRKPDLR